MNIRKFLLTAMTEGGGSYSLFSGETNPTNGYMVSLKGHEYRVKHINMDVMRDYFSRNAHLLILPDHYLGLWQTADEWVLDVSVNEADIDRAIELGENNDQQAIWDCANATEIWIEQIKKAI